MSRPLLCIASMLAWSLAGCDYDHQTIDFERMIDQHRYDPYEPSPYFADGKVMRRPPQGTVPRERPLLPLVVERGLTGPTDEAALVDHVPIPVTAALMERGQDRYDIFCAPCHGILGDADTQVAENMKLRPPRSLHDPQVRAYPAGRIYRVITEGYGLMRSYAGPLPVLDRWAVVAYVQALQRSQHASLDALPAPMRTEARPWLQ